MNIAILGTGAYGLSLAIMFLENNCKVKMWTKFEEERKSLDIDRTSTKALPGIKIPKEIDFTCDMREAVKEAQLVVIVIPIAFVDSTLRELGEHVNKSQHYLIATKGIEQDSCFTVFEILNQYIDTKKYALISGPSFAIDMANKVPTGLSLSTLNKETDTVVRKALENKYLTLISDQDVIGTAICGAVKNIVAIASGIISGLGLPESSQAMLITNAIHDISSLIVLLGGSKDTILTYSGVGDLIMTCTSTKSRNFQLGTLIGKKKSKEEIDNYLNNNTVEGLYNLHSIHQLLKKKNSKIQLIETIYNIVLNGDNPEKILT